MAPPRIDLLDPEFYVDGARDAEANTTVFSSAGGSNPGSGPLPWMIDMDPPGHRKR